MRAHEADNRYRRGGASGAGGDSGGGTGSGAMAEWHRRAGSTAMATGTTEFSRTTRDDERLDRRQADTAA